MHRLWWFVVEIPFISILAHAAVMPSQRFLQINKINLKMQIPEKV